MKTALFIILLLSSGVYASPTRKCNAFTNCSAQEIHEVCNCSCESFVRLPAWIVPSKTEIHGGYHRKVLRNGDTRFHIHGVVKK